jgi:hypothetical protein
MKTYAGIGSRQTPQDILSRMKELAELLGNRGYVLRTGGASGADTAFYEGSLRANGGCQMMLPWKGFNGHSKGWLPSPACYELAKQHHPNWDKLTRGGRALHARNCQQILGPNLNDPVKFVVGWTDDGKGSGGTGQAYRVAKSMNIKIFDLYNGHMTEEILEYADG